MKNSENPALSAFLKELGKEFQLAQVVITRQGKSFEIKHIDDQKKSSGSLRNVPPREARSIVQATASGAFRPLKSAPNLISGWRILCSVDAELEIALNIIYPGAIPDWFAALAPIPPITHYRPFTQRQSGMYRITTFLNDSQAAEMIQACCAPIVCLKRRLWSVEGLPTDDLKRKSVIPCLEPCALLLEFARRKARLEQEVKVSVALSPGEIATLQAVLGAGLAQTVETVPEGDMGNPLNRRRILMLRNKMEEYRPTKAGTDSAEGTVSTEVTPE